MALTRIDSYLVDLDSLGGIAFDDQAGVPTFKVDAVSHRVGIGTASPDALFTIYTSSSNSTKSLRLTDSVGLINIGHWDNVHNRIEFGNKPSLIIGYGAGNYLGLGAGGSERLRITSDGNVGIGTTNPTEKFQVQGRIIGTSGLRAGTTAAIASSGELLSVLGQASIRLDSSTSATTYFINANTTVNTIQPYLFCSDTAGNRAGIGIEYSTTITSFYGQGGISLQTGTSGFGYANDRLRITSSGNVGIGTTNPGAKLQARGSDTIISALVTSGNYGSIGITSEEGSDLQFGYAKNSSNYGAQTIAGDFSIKTTASRLHFPVGSGNANSVMVLTSGGNVGIGTTNPEVKLDVFGIIKTSGAGSYISLNNNGYIRGDATGELRFQGGTSGTTFYSAGNSVEFIRINNSGNVGIGTTNPIAKTHIRLIGDTAEPVLYLHRANNSGGGAGNPEIGLEVNIPNTYNSAGTVYGVKVFARHNLGDTHYGGYFEAGGNAYSSGIGVYAKTTHTDTNGPGYQPAILADAYSNIGISNSGYAVGVLAQTNDYVNNINAILKSNYTGSSNQTVLRIERNGSYVGYITTTQTTSSFLNSSSSGLIGDSINQISLYTSSSPRITINSTGNVGIGTTNPTSLLHLRSTVPWINIDKSGTSIESNESGIRWTYNDSPMFYFYTDNTGSSDLKLQSGTIPADNDNTPRIWIPRTNTDLYINLSGGKVGIGTIQPQEEIELYGAGGTNPTMLWHHAGQGSYKVGVHNTVFKIAAMDNGFGGHSGSFTTNNSQVIALTQTGNVGIGTTNPSNNIHVVGSGFITERLGVATNTLTARVNINASLNGSVGGLFIDAKTRDSAESNVPLLQIDSGIAGGNKVGALWFSTSGNLGINTTTPNQKLTLTDGNLSLFTTSYTAGEVIHKTITSYARNGIYSNLFQADAEICFGKVDGFDVDWTHGGFISFKTTHNNRDGAPVERLRITQLGNIGIGTTNPLTRLDSRGTILISTNITGNNILAFGNSTAYGPLNGAPDSSHGSSFIIGNSSDGSGAPSHLSFWTTTGGTVGERVRITSNGNVGIGTTNPDIKLQVFGSIGINGNAGGAYPLFVQSNQRYCIGIKNTAADANYPWLAHDTDSGQSALVFHFNGVADRFVFREDGSFSKVSGSFKIEHPLPEKSETHNLVHSFVESPQANNIYRGKVTLSGGSAIINLDEVSGMTEGTFVLLNRDIHCFTSNESDWDAVKGSVNRNILTIQCQNPSSTAEVTWLVVGERHDQHMYDAVWTDENGKVIVEPLKESL